MIHRVEWTRPSGRVTRFDFGSLVGAEAYAEGLAAGTVRIVALEV